MLWRLETQSFVIRDQFTVLPIPDEVIKMLDAMAAKDGITRAIKGNPGDKGFPDEDCVSNGSHRLPSPIEDDESDENDEVVKGPAMKPIPPDRRLEGLADVDIEDADDDEEDDRANTPSQTCRSRAI